MSHRSKHTHSKRGKRKQSQPAAPAAPTATSPLQRATDKPKSHRKPHNRNRSTSQPVEHAPATTTATKSHFRSGVSQNFPQQIPTHMPATADPAQSTPNTSNTSTRSHNSRLATHSIPKSRRHRNRRGALAANTRASLLDSTYSRADRKRETLEAHSPYNPHQSFFSRASCDEILSALILALKSQPATDVHIHPSGYRIRGRHFLDSACCEFQIEMLATPASHATHPGHVLVEVQHRNGDGFVFQRFLHAVFAELRKTELVAATQYPRSTHCALSPLPMHTRAAESGEEEEKQGARGQAQVGVQAQEVLDDATLRMLLCALLDSRGEREVCRMASAYFARHMRQAGGEGLVRRMQALEPMLVVKLSELLLKCVDPETMQSVGCALEAMLSESEAFKGSARRLNLKGVCKKARARWAEPVEARYDGNSKYVIRVISSEQVARRMTACIEVLQ